IDPEWLATVIDRTTARTIGVRQRITLREKVTFLIQRTERFITDFVIEEHELAEVGSSSIVDVHLPTTLTSLSGPLPRESRYFDPFGSTIKAPKRPITVNSRSWLYEWNCRTPSCICGWMYHSNSCDLPGATIDSGLVVVAGLPVALMI